MDAVGNTATRALKPPGKFEEEEKDEMEGDEKMGDEKEDNEEDGDEQDDMVKRRGLETKIQTMTTRRVTARQG